MERDFEIEYQNMIRDEAPDFWGAIEAKLDQQEKAKAADAFQSVPAQPVQMQPVQTMPQNAQPVAFTKKKKFRWQYVALPAAAVLCAALILPIMLHTRNAATESAATNKPAAVQFAGSEKADTDYMAMSDAACAEEAEKTAGAALEEQDLREKNGMNYLSTQTDNAATTEAEGTRDVETEAAMEEEAEADGELPSAIILTLRVAEDAPSDMEIRLKRDYYLEVLHYDEELREYTVRSARQLTVTEEESLEKTLAEDPYVEELRREGEE